MNSEIENDVTARKWAQDFDEVAGRAAPPDRVDAILRRVSMEADTFPRPHDESPRAVRFWPAALVLLSVGVTIGVSVLRSESDAVTVATPAVATLGVKSTAQDKKTAREKQAEQDKKDAAQKKAPNEKANEEKARIARAEVELKRLTALYRVAGKQAKDRRMEGRIAALQAEIRALVAAQDKAKATSAKGTPAKAGPGPKKGAVKDQAARQRVLIERMLALKEAEAALAQRFQPLGRIAPRARFSLKPNNPLIQGDYEKALEQLTGKRSKLDITSDPAAARKIIDEMTRILGDARRALWEAEQAAKVKKK